MAGMSAFLQGAHGTRKTFGSRRESWTSMRLPMSMGLPVSSNSRTIEAECVLWSAGER